MSTLRLHRLEGFFYVARTGSYTRAAAVFPYPIGQPAVYQQVKGLQEDLGVVLVRQAGPRRTVLTPEGRALYEFIAPFFDGLPNVVERLKRAELTPLVFGADQILAMEALPPALLRARAQRPDFLVRVEELPIAEIVERVGAGAMDAGLVHLPSVPRGMRWAPLGRIGIALLIPAAHPLAKLGRVPSPEETAKHPLILYEPHSPGRALAERLFREFGVRLKVAAEVTFAQTMRSLVRAGLAPAFVPYVMTGRSGQPDPDDLPKLPQTVAYEVTARLRAGPLPFGLLYRPGMEESAAFQLLAACLRERWA